MVAYEALSYDPREDLSDAELHENQYFLLSLILKRLELVTSH